jgi:hypothetical protein
MATRRFMGRGHGRMRCVFRMRRIDGEEISVSQMRRSGTISLPGNSQAMACVSEGSRCGSLLQPDSSSREDTSSAGRAAISAGFR